MKFQFLKIKFLHKLVYLIMLGLGIVILFSCNFKSSKRIMLKQEQCQREILYIESYKEFREKKLSLLENFIKKIQIKDSLLTVLVFQGPIVIENYHKSDYTSNLKMESCFEKITKETPCIKFEKENNRLRNILTDLKLTEEKCENYINLMDYIASKDSLFRKELSLELLPFNILYKVNFKNNDKDIPKLDCFKQLDDNIDRITKQTYFLTRSQNEILEYLKTIKNTL